MQNSLSLSLSTITHNLVRLLMLFFRPRTLTFYFSAARVEYCVVVVVVFVCVRSLCQLSWVRVRERDTDDEGGSLKRARETEKEFVVLCTSAVLHRPQSKFEIRCGAESLCSFVAYNAYAPTHTGCTISGSREQRNCDDYTCTNTSWRIRYTQELMCKPKLRRATIMISSFFSITSSFFCIFFPLTDILIVRLATVSKTKL